MELLTNLCVRGLLINISLSFSNTVYTMKSKEQEMDPHHIPNFLY